MSIEPTENEMIIALRLATKQYKQDLQEAKKDLDLFKKYITEIDADIKKIGEDAKVGTEQQRPLTDLEKIRLKVLGQEKKEMEALAKLSAREARDKKLAINRTRLMVNQLKLGGKERERALSLAKRMEVIEKNITKIVEKRAKQEEKARKEKEKQEKEANRGFITSLKERTRLYGVLSARGARMIATTRGAAGAIIMALTTAFQTLSRIIAFGIRNLREYEQIALRIGVIQFGAGMAPTVGAGVQAGMQWAFGPPPGLAALGATGREAQIMQLLRLQSGLAFTDENLESIRAGAAMANEDVGQFMTNLIQYLQLFNIEAEDFEEAIAVFGYMGARTMGGTAALGQSLDYIAGLARTGGWDWKQMLAMQEQLRKEGRDTSRFWRAMRGVIGDIIKDDTQLVESIRGVDGQLRSFDEVIWILDETMDAFNDETLAAEWAIEQFGERGYEAIQMLRDLVDDQHEYSDILDEATHMQEEATAALEQTKDFLEEESLNAAILRLQTQVEATANKFVAILSPAIILVADALTHLFKILEEAMIAPEHFEYALGGGGEAGEAYREEWRRRSEEHRMEAEEELGRPPTALDFFLDLLRGDISAWFPDGDDDDVETDRDADYDPYYEGRDECGRDPRNPYYGQPCGAEYEEEPAEEGSPATFSMKPVARGGGTKKTTITNHNYITVMDNDAIIRGLLGVNLNVQ